MPYANVTPEGLREMILHLVRNDDEVKQAILGLIRREGEKRMGRWSFKAHIVYPTPDT